MRVLPGSSRSRHSKTPSRTSRPRLCPQCPGSPPRPKCPPFQSCHPSRSAPTSQAFPQSQDGRLTQGARQSQDGPQRQRELPSPQGPGQGQGQVRDQSPVYLPGLAYQLCQSRGAAVAAARCRRFRAVHVVKRHHFSKIHIFDSR